MLPTPTEYKLDIGTSWFLIGFREFVEQRLVPCRAPILPSPRLGLAFFLLSTLTQFQPSYRPQEQLQEESVAGEVAW